MRIRICAVLAGVGLVSTSVADEVLVSSRFTNNILRYDATSGAFQGVFADNPELKNPNGIALGPDGRVYAGLGDDDAILSYDLAGNYLGPFVDAGEGGLDDVRDIVFGPDGDLYAVSGSTDQVLRFDGQTGDFVSVAASGGGLDGPVGLAFGPTGELYVAGALSNRVYVFDNGTLQRSFNAGPTHSNSVGLAFNADGRLLVSQSVTNEVLAFNPLSGAFQGVFATGGLNIPIYMNIDSHGDLWVGSFGNNRVRKYDGLTGALIATPITVGSGGLNGTHDIIFIPEPTTLMALGALASLLHRRRA